MAIKGLIKCLELLRRRAPGLNLHEALTILVIAERPGVTVAQLASELRVSPSSASRYARALASADELFARSPSWGLIAIAPHADARCVSLCLSKAGQALVEELQHTLTTSDGARLLS